MSVSRRLVNGAKVWVIDRRFKNLQGEERYRRAAKDQRSKQHAEAEEREVCAYFKEHGSLKGLLNPQEAPKTKKKDHTWDEAVTHYKANDLLALAESTRKGYEAILENPAFAKAWNGRKLGGIKRADLLAYQNQLAKDHKPGTVHQHRSVLRAVLTSVGPHEGEPGLMLDELPPFPAKLKIGRQGFECPTDEEVAILFAEKVTPGSYLQPRSLRRMHLAFALAAYAGLRASEVRGLLRDDVDLEASIITIRRSKSFGKVGKPKSGHEREIPFAHPTLVRLLTERCKEMQRSEERHIAVNVDGLPWGQYGLRLAYTRTCKRLKLKLSKFHGLRHYYATSLFGMGVDAPTIQDTLGHSSLAVTQRYSHTSRRRKVEAITAAYASAAE